MTNRRNLRIGGAAAFGLGSPLQAWNPGKPWPLVDDIGQPIAGSLSERVFAQINGIRQGMIIQTRDFSHPVLLFLHGGPDMPEFFLNNRHPAGLEQDFSLVWWEQRGAGLSFIPDIPSLTMTIAQMIAETVAVADCLWDRFRQEKIILPGHSLGSFPGIQVAAAVSDRFHAYISMGQLFWQLRSEVAARCYMLDRRGARGDTAMVRKIEAAPASLTDGLSKPWLRLRDTAMHGMRVGTTRDMASVITEVFLPVWQCRAYCRDGGKHRSGLGPGGGSTHRYCGQ